LKTLTDLTCTTKKLSGLLPLLALSFYGVGVSAGEIDWSAVEPTTVKVFYPGVSSWDFMKSKDHGSGANPVKTGKKSCAVCHVNKRGEYDIAADDIISGELTKVASAKPLEPTPVAGLPGFKDVSMQAAFDSENLYLRFQWESEGASFKDAALAKDDLTDRISIQFADKIKTFNKYGCYITCHDDQEGMPKSRGSDTKLYTYYARKNGTMVPAEKLDKYLSKGQFVDLWIASFEGSQVVSSDQYVLADRIDDKNDLEASGGFENGKYTVVIKRKLATGDSGDLVFKEGSAFSLDIAIHDLRNTGRKHYTSFPVSIGLATEADVSASKF